MLRLCVLNFTTTIGLMVQFAFRDVFLFPSGIISSDIAVKGLIRLPVAYNVFWIDLIVVKNDINIWMVLPVHTRVEQITMRIGGVNWGWPHIIRISLCVAASENSSHEHPPELPRT